VDGDRALSISKALEIIKRSDGPVCVDCLALTPSDEEPLLAEFRKHIPPTHRITEDFCMSCAKRKRVVRRVRSA
jgi:hypothetical protein